MHLQQILSAVINVRSRAAIKGFGIEVACSDNKRKENDSMQSQMTQNDLSGYLWLSGYCLHPFSLLGNIVVERHGGHLLLPLLSGRTYLPAI